MKNIQKMNCREFVEGHELYEAQGWNKKHSALELFQSVLYLAEEGEKMSSAEDGEVYHLTDWNENKNTEYEVCLIKKNK